MKRAVLVLLILLMTSCIHQSGIARKPTEKEAFEINHPILKEIPSFEDLGLRLINSTITTTTHYGGALHKRGNTYTTIGKPYHISTFGGFGQEIKLDWIPGTIINDRGGYYYGGRIYLTKPKNSKNLIELHNSLARQTTEGTGAKKELNARNTRIGNFQCYEDASFISASSTQSIACNNGETFIYVWLSGSGFVPSETPKIMAERIINSL